MRNFDGEYIRTSELGTFEDGRVIELGHYKNNADGKEYGDKIYIRSTYKNRNGEEKESIVATKLSLKDLAELQKIDLSGFDTDAEVDFD